jgi:hypothetical protein
VTSSDVSLRLPDEESERVGRFALLQAAQKHLAEFLALATGGPAHYIGRQIEVVHGNMHISNPEFDAVIGDLKTCLDNLKIPNLEQKGTPRHRRKHPPGNCDETLRSGHT